MMESNQLTLFAEASHASHFQSQVSKEVQMMIDTSGLKCSDSSKKSVLDGLLVKMCSDSSKWHSTMCALTWKVLVTKSSRIVYRLVARTLTTDEIESGLWATPNTLDGIGQRSYEAMKRQATNGGRKNRSRPENLREQVDPLMRQAYDEARAEANGMMWPTPRAAECEGGVVKNTVCSNGSFSRVNAKGVRFGVKLKDAVACVEKMWPTPNAEMWKNRGHLSNESIQRRIKKGKQIDLSMCVSETSGILNPDWVEALMGYPVGWTDLTKDVTHEMADFVSNPDGSGEPRVTVVNNGRAQRLKQLGNSIVPQVAREIFKAIREVENG